MTESEVKEKFPSVCYNCRYARNPWSDENRDKGYVGCALYLKTRSYNHVGNAKELALGWINPTTRIFAKSDVTATAGLVYNNQLLTLMVASCDGFEREKL